jgi:hypothetical protein
LKTIMRKKNFTSPDKVIKYEENDMTNQLPEGFMDAFLGKNMKMNESRFKNVVRGMGVDPDLVVRGMGKGPHAAKDKARAAKEPKKTLKSRAKNVARGMGVDPDNVMRGMGFKESSELPEGFMDAMKQLVPGARNPQKPQEGKKTAMEMQFPYARLSVHRMIVALRKARGTAMKGKAQGKDRRENERSLGYILAHVEDIARTRHAEQPNSGRQIHDTRNIDDQTQSYFMDKIRQNDWTKADQEILNAMVGNGTDDNTKGGAYHARTLAHDIALSVKYAKKDAGIKESVELDELKIDMPKKGAGLGITRDKMPQVDEKDYPEYFAYLKEKGITLKKGKEDPNNLKPIQKEFAKIGVEKSLDKMLAQKDKAKFIIVSKDDYIVDGHHRWLAAKNGRQQLNVMRANVNMKELLKATNEFPKTTFKSIKNVVKNMQEVRQESKHTKKYKKMFGETKPCWDGYVARGMKKKGDKMVPNCVPEETVNSESVQSDNIEFYKKLFGNE